jgi:hypothetical protein
VSALTGQMWRDGKVRRTLNSGKFRDFYRYYPLSHTLGEVNSKPKPREYKFLADHPKSAPKVAYKSTVDVEQEAKNFVYEHRRPQLVRDEVEEFVEYLRKKGLL